MYPLGVDYNIRSPKKRPVLCVHEISKPDQVIVIMIGIFSFEQSNHDHDRLLEFVNKLSTIMIAFWSLWTIRSQSLSTFGVWSDFPITDRDQCSKKSDLRVWTLKTSNHSVVLSAYSSQSCAKSANTFVFRAITRNEPYTLNVKSLYGNIEEFCMCVRRRQWTKGT